jgi:type III pantothenate kinase
MLAADIGNTRIKTAVFSESGEIHLKANLAHHELPQLVEMMESEGCGIISNVSHISNDHLPLEGYVVLQSGLPVPVEITYRSPESLGTDRLALACGAGKLFPGKNCLVISAGTCITYDLWQQAEYTPAVEFRPV